MPRVRAVFLGRLEGRAKPGGGVNGWPAEDPGATPSRARDPKHRFAQWIHGRRFFVSPKLDLWSGRGVDGRGVVAKADIHAGETLAVIPTFVSMDHPCLAGVKVAVAELSLTLQLAVGLLHLLFTDDHPFKPYIDMLPEKVTNALELTDEHRHDLRGTCIEDELNVSIMEQRHQTLVLPILKRHRGLWPSCSYSFGAFKRAIFLLMSRGFFSANIGGPYLVPVADLFNHSHSRRCTQLEQNDGAFRLRAERDIKAGEEVFNSYGPLGNARLFHTFGFIEDGNPFDEVHLPRALVVEACESWARGREQAEVLLQRKQTTLRSCGLLLDLFVLSKADLIPSALLTLLQVYVMEEEEFDEFEANPSLLGADFDPDDKSFVASVYGLMVIVLRRKLLCYAEPEMTLQQEQAAIVEAESRGDGTRRCILAIRHQERRMLMELLAQLVAELRELQGSVPKAEERGPEGA